MNLGDLMPVLLLLLIGSALSLGVGMVALVIRWVRRHPLQPIRLPHDREMGRLSRPRPRTVFLRRPNHWLAVKSRNLAAVQSALGMHNAKPCSWMEGLEEKLFIAPPVRGWTLVIGLGLPDPSEDVDACFRFVLDLSRKFGQVQFFSANRILQHHAWVRADGGRVLRAYAWAGRTLWLQGARTTAEKELGLKCFDYGETGEAGSFGKPNVMAANVEKVPLLAARWSLDPEEIDEQFLEQERGIAGELGRRF